jgi:calcineurin-like phosphoesterase family protein
MKKINLKSANQKIWFVADLHVAHNKPFILGPRNYTTVDEAIQHTFKMLHDHIGSDDIIFNLGDAVCGAGDNSQAYAKRVATFPCKKQYFIWGNHNAGVNSLYDETRSNLGLFGGDTDVDIYPLDYPGTPFTFLGHYAEVIIDGVSVVLTHYPITSWNGMGEKGAFHIHGHCHRNLKETMARRLDVGWDWKKRPVEWKEIYNELRNQKTTLVDHHGATEKFFE